MAVEPLIFELSCPGRRGVQFPPADVPTTELPSHLRRDRLDWPEVSEIDVVRHFTRVSQKNHAIDINFYPLGSCTMKYNPKINEAVARYAGFASAHPLQDEATVQGSLELMYELQEMLAKISGFPHVTMQPAAGAQGEFTGVLVMRAYHHARGDDARTHRSWFRTPRTARTRRPPPWPVSRSSLCHQMSAAMSTSPNCGICVGPDTAGLMITNPNTLGLWDENIREAIRVVHEAGGLVYNDGANFNAILGMVAAGRSRHRHHALQPAQDLLDPARRRRTGLRAGRRAQGTGAVPARTARREGGRGRVRMGRSRAESVGRLHGFHGNLGMHVRAYTYIRMHGEDGLAPDQPRRGAGRQLPARQPDRSLRSGLRPHLHARVRALRAIGRRRSASRRSTSPSACSTSAFTRRPRTSR